MSLILWARCPEHDPGLPADRKPLCSWCLVADDLNQKQATVLTEKYGPVAGWPKGLLPSWVRV